MGTRGRDDYEKLAAAKIVDCGESVFLSPSPYPLRDVDVVLADDLLVGSFRVFMRGNSSGDVEIVTTGDIVDAQMPDEPARVREFTAIHLFRSP